MAFPSPTIYTYRVVEKAGNQGPSIGRKQYYIAEFSTNSGTTWSWLFEQPFNSLQEAYQAIAKIVDNEAQFQIQYLQSSAFNNKQIVPTSTVFSYPPA